MEKEIDILSLQLNKLKIISEDKTVFDIIHIDALGILEIKFEDFFKKNNNKTKTLSYYYAHLMNKYVIKINKMQYLGCMSGVKFPKNVRKNKILIIFFAPSNSTNVGNEDNDIDWDPYIQENGELVKTFQHLKNKISIDFDDFYLVDMFPHRIWEEDLEIDDLDIEIANSWLNNQIKIINPKKIFIANKTYGRRLKLERDSLLICHPGYANRRPDIIIPEWKIVIDNLDA